MAVGAVEHQHVHARVEQRAGAVEDIVRHADGRGAQQPPRSVLGGVGVLHDLFDVLDRDEPPEVVFLVDDRQLFDAVMAQDLLGLLQRRADLAGDEPLARHDLGDLAAEVFFKFHVAVGDDADELVLLVHDRNAGDAVFRHQRLGVAERFVRRQREGIGDDAVFRALDQIDLLGLHVDRHVLMDDADAALARDGDGHAVLGDGVHGGAHDGDVQSDLVRQTGGKVDVGGEHVALCGDKQHIVKGQPFADDPVGIQFGKIHRNYPLI